MLLEVLPEQLLFGTPYSNFMRELMGIIHSDQVPLESAGFQPNFLGR
ncbi:hypothetical protein NSP_42830 [Nodularia spumigena CCY9414]|nr:hypothetical protein NSP_42830 [Nodularia spumigena CCY9414]